MTIYLVSTDQEARMRYTVSGLITNHERIEFENFLSTIGPGWVRCSWWKWFTFPLWRKL